MFKKKKRKNSDEIKIVSDIMKKKDSMFMVSITELTKEDITGDDKLNHSVIISDNFRLVDVMTSHEEHGKLAENMIKKFDIVDETKDKSDKE